MIVPAVILYVYTAYPIELKIKIKTRTTIREMQRALVRHTLVGCKLKNIELVRLQLRDPEATYARPRVKAEAERQKREAELAAKSVGNPDTIAL
jgi:hypothetical protein